MQVSNNIRAFAIVAGFLLSFSWLPNAQAVPSIRKETVKIDGITDSPDEMSADTPTVSPPASPEPSPTPPPQNPLTPISYPFDLNDALFFRYHQQYSVEVVGLPPAQYATDRRLRLVLTPKAGQTPIDLVVGVTLVRPGEFKIQLFDFDDSKYEASLQSFASNGDLSKTVLAPEAIVNLKVHNMSALKYPGENPPSSIDAPHEETLLADRRAIYLTSQKGGTLWLLSKAMIDTSNVPQQPTPTQPTTPTNPPANPGSSSNGGNNAPTLPTAAGPLGGGGGLRCSLHATGAHPLNLLVMVGLLPLVWAVRKKKSR